MPELNDQHYLQAVTELGNTRMIVADRDIYSQNRIKLIASGMRINSQLYDRLIKHKLLELDKTLSIDNMLNADRIRDDVASLLQENAKLAKMQAIIGKNFLYSRVLAIQLPSPLAFKLTVARDKYNHIYRHSLMLMIIVVYLAHCNGMNSAEQECAATAALFHDIGLLHIDPKLLAPSHVMSDTERHHLYSHPLTAYLLLCEFPELPRCIAEAVLVHHERMDGSGYPRGLRGDKISRYGQILAVAEIAAKAFDSNHPKVSWKNLEVMLKLNFRQYGQGLIGHLNIFRENDAPTALSDNMSHLITKVNLIAQLFENFNQHANAISCDQMFDLAKTRMVALRLKLLEAGFDPHDPARLIQIFTDDLESRSDYSPLLNEALWQFKALLREISRRWPEVSVDEAQPKRAENEWLNNMKRSLLSADINK
ncbi:HD-GYP domain-containing protein [Gallionella capsiferriformans]|jgi:hypothetical protein|uniref:Metal dependent phosphohydrolase n=1 Tax=Gallionella capsiferriformans (strain ES-2) TaxID=395494 RepID=D9SI71_GALCS|nr:HD domain-containing phosphohydrolase [Gallionella capsiferriformans]ADL54128.1 metal dependent phosphohydrolase [Gallionella capsiferriformans ES-2]